MFLQRWGFCLDDPIEDVRGFIELTDAAACIQATGRCTATYHSKRRCLRILKRRRKVFIQLLAEDIDMRLILEIYKEETAADCGIGGIKMSKISVVYWSQSGNTAAMAEAVAKGVTDAGKEAEIVFVSSASIDELKSETAFALGCPGNGCRGT